jgi:hypothetical protein
MASEKKPSHRNARSKRKTSVGAERSHSLRQFVRKLRGTEPALILFKEHAAAHAFPETSSWGKIRSYLLSDGAPHEEIVAARLAWRQFRSR